MFHTCLHTFSFQKLIQEKRERKSHKPNDEIPVFLIDKFAAYNSNYAF